MLIQSGQEELLKLNPRVYLELISEGENLGRIVIELFKDKVPILAQDICHYFTGERGIGKQSGVTLHFKNTPLKNLIKGLGPRFSINKEILSLKENDMIQANYFAYGHDHPGLLTINPTLDPTLTLTIRPAPHLDGCSVVVGRIIKGFHLLNKLDQFEVDSDDIPFKEVRIKECGELELKLPEGWAIRIKDDQNDTQQKKRKKDHNQSYDRYKDKYKNKDNNYSDKEREKKDKGYYKEDKRNEKYRSYERERNRK